MLKHSNRTNIFRKISSGIVCGILLIMLFGSVASAAHTYDASMADGTTGFATTPNPRNLSYTAGGGATVMVLNIFTATTTARAGGDPTFNNKTMTPVGARQSDTSEGAVEMWYLLLDASDTGSANNISVPNTGSLAMRLHASTYKSATGASALDVYAQKYATVGANPNQTIVTTVNGDVMIDALFSGYTSVNTATPNIGSALFAQDGGAYGAASRYYLQPTAGSQNLSWTLASDDYALITAAFKEVAISMFNISGYVTDKSSGAGLNLATVQINSTPVKTTTTNLTGYYNFSGISDGTYLINASLTGYDINSTIRIINGGDITDADIQLSPQAYIPPTPSSLASQQGNFWINYTWLPGSGFFTDSYNVSVNSIWTNGTTQTFNLSNVGAHGWSNISVYAFNNSGTGSLNTTPATSNTQVANKVPVQALADNWGIMAGNLLTFTVSATDADTDTLTFGTNATGGILNHSTGVYSWMPSSADTGPHFWSFSSDDGYGGIATNTTTITVSDTSGTYINGTVKSGGTGVEGVTVSTNTTISTTTDAFGFYSLPVTAGTYQLTAAREPVYYPNSSVTAAVSSGVVVQDIELLIKPKGTISGSVANG